MMKKKILALFLSVLMVLSVMPNYMALAETACTHVFASQDQIDKLGDDLKKSNDFEVNGSALISTVQPATCKEDGWMIEADVDAGIGYCVLCNETFGKKTTIAKKAHTEVSANNGVDATCTTDGKESDTICDVCGETLTTGATITAPGHVEISANNGVDATCTTDGKKSDTICDVCSETVTTGDVITAFGHTPVSADNAVAETCTTDGKEADTICDVCGEKLEDGATIPAHHNYVKYPDDHPLYGYKKGNCKENDPDVWAEYCTECGDWQSRNKIVHTPQEKEGTAKAPTCTEAGKEADIECKECGKLLETGETIDALGHDYENGTVVKAPTCTEDGYTTYTCQRDGCTETHTGDTVEKLGHDLKHDVEIPATCEENGTKEGDTCQREGCDYKIGYDVILALGHAYVDVTDSYADKKDGFEHKDATCTEKGKEVDRYCSVCYKYFVGAEIEMIPHDMQDVLYKDSTCAEVGNQAGQKCSACPYTTGCEEIAKKSHNFDNTDTITIDPTCEKSGMVKTKCRVCDQYVQTDWIQVLGHNYSDWIVSTPATCETDAIETRTCPNPGCENPTETRTVEDSALGHTYEIKENVDPTCTETGYTTFKCSRSDCDVVFTELIKKIPHTSVDVYGTYIAPTCTEAGKESDTICIKCGEELTTGAEIPATGHIEVSANNEVAPTCTETGKESDTICDVCGETLTVGATIPALGHSYVTVTDNDTPNCVHGVITHIECDRTGCDYEESPVDDGNIDTTLVLSDVVKNNTITTDVDPMSLIVSTGHDYAVVATAAKCTEDKYYTFTCQREDCAENAENHEFVITVLNTRTGHVWNDLADDEGNVPATCTQEGRQVQFCLNDNTHRRTLTVNPLNHQYTKTNVEPTCDEAGKIVYTCACGDTYYVTNGHPTGHKYEVAETVPATCTEEGCKKMVCSECSDTYLVSINPTGHKSTKLDETTAKAPTCTTAGNTANVVCTECDAVVSYGDVIPALGHVYVKTTVVEATCQNVASTTYKCTVCGDTKVELGTSYGAHRLIQVSATAPTCTEDGKIVEMCQDCMNLADEDARFVKETPIPATGHEYVKTTVVEATCQNVASTTYKCTVCDDTKVEYGTSLGAHRLIQVSAVAPTCTEDGKIVEMCQDCMNLADEDARFVKETPVPATGHKFGESVTYVATCTSQLTKIKKCEICDTEEKEVEVNGAFGEHKTVKTLTKTATTKADGEYSYICSVCDKTVSTEAIPAIGSVTLDYTAISYNGSARKPVVNVVDKNGEKIADTNYTVSYSNNVQIGKATVKVVFSGKYSGTVTKTFKINPKGVGISSTSKTKNSITVNYGKVANATGYQIQYSTKSDFSSKKTVTVADNKIGSKKITGLKSATKYYIRIRSYKVVDGTKYYSNWTSFTRTTAK